MILSTIVPNNYMMPFEAVKSWLKLPKYPFVYAQGPDLDFNRNFVWRQVKDKNDHLLMIDSDIVFTPDDVEAIENHLERGYDAITGIYPVGMEPYPPCVFKRIVGDYTMCEVQEGLNEIDACGGGFLGIHREVIKKMPNDPFDNIREGDIFHGEDISFCHRLKELGFKLWADSSIQVAQIRTQNIYVNRINTQKQE